MKRTERELWIGRWLIRVECRATVVASCDPRDAGVGYAFHAHTLRIAARATELLGAAGIRCAWPYVESGKVRVELVSEAGIDKAMEILADAVDEEDAAMEAGAF